jgi:hypothetical protein
MKKEKSNIEAKDDILANIRSQIESFDHKAEILLAVIGVLFGLSITAITSLSQLSEGTKKSGYFTYFLVFAALFAVSSVLSIVLTLLVIYPRKKNSQSFDSCYYLDIANNHERFAQSIKDLTYNDASAERQIVANADICAKKHRCFVASIWSLIPFSVFLILELVFFVLLSTL